MQRNLSLAVGILMAVAVLQACAPRGSHQARCNTTGVVGAVAGGVLGNQIGGGTGNTIATAVGAAAGASAARTEDGC